jgi:hypothetical protein
MLTAEKVNSMSTEERLNQWGEKMEERILIGILLEYMDENKNEYSPEELEGAKQSLGCIDSDIKVLLGGL